MAFDFEFDWIIVVAVLVTLGAIGGVISMFLSRRSESQLASRLNRTSGKQHVPIVPATATAPESEKKSLLTKVIGGLATVALGGKSTAPPPTPVAAEEKAEEKKDDASLLRQRLIQAGYTGPSALNTFLAMKLVLAVSFPLLALAVKYLLFPTSQMSMVSISIGLTILGYMLPNQMVGSKVKQRQLELAKSLPDALDLLVTSVEAGLGLDTALQRIANEISLSSPLLGAELEKVFLEVKAGIRRAEAFRRLYWRTGLDDLKSLAAVLAQAEAFGTSISASLREQAVAIRSRRIYAAEGKAARASVKMTVPLILFVLPSLMLIIMGPAGLQIYDNLIAKP